MDVLTISVITVIFISTLVTSTLGFGLGLISMPLLAFFIDIKTATPLIAIVGTVMAFFIFIRNWREVNFRSIWKLILACLAGLPIGLYFLKGADDAVMKTVLAILIILFALYSLLSRVQVPMKAEWPSFGFGLLSGVFGAAYNIPAPTVMIYATLKKWPPTVFRATLFSFFFPSSIIIVTSHFITGLVTQPVLYYSALSLPFVVFSTIIGGILNRRIPAERFNNIVYLGLLLIGCFLLFKVITDVV